MPGSMFAGISRRFRPERRYDVFFCYSWKDKREADAMVAALRAHRVNGRALRVFQDDKEMKDYDLITPAVNAALARSRCLVVLYSENLPASAYCRFELRYALSAAHCLDGTPQRVMAILRNVAYEDVRPGSLGALRLPDPRTATRDHLVASIGARVARTDRRVLGDAGEAPPPRWFPGPLAGTRSFHGRDLEVWDVYDALHEHQDPSFGGVSVARIVGLGGQGKTALAEQYARAFAADYPGGVFVLRGFGSHLADRAEPHHVRLRHADLLADFARRLRLDVRHLDRAATAQALSDHLEETAQPYLWIIDDLPSGIDRDTFTSLLAPTRDGHTLITTRHRPDGYGDVWGSEVVLEGLDTGSALGLLTSRRPAADRTERAIALELTARLGCHPLALAVAAGLLARPDQDGFAGLAAAVDAAGPDVLELGERLWGDLPTGHRAGIAATMLRSVDHLGRAGRDLLRVASTLASAPVPRSLAEGILAYGDGTDPAASKRKAAEGFREASALSLIDDLRVGDQDHWIVHTMVIRTMRHADPDDPAWDRLRIGAVEELTAALDRTPGGFTTPALSGFLPHVHEVASALATEDEWHLVNEAGRVHVELSDVRSALVWYRRLYEACGDVLGAGHETTLTVLAGLGTAYGLMGDHETALDHKTRAYEGLAAMLGTDDPEVLTAYNNVAVTHHDRGDHEAARAIYARVYRTRRRVLGSQHTDTLSALSNYAIAVGAGGRHELALRLKRGLLRSCTAALGAEHPMTLDTLNNLAASVFALGDRSEAHRLLVDVHEARRRILGADHADTLTAGENAAVTAATRAEAVLVLEDVYRRRLNVLGPEHPETVRVLRTVLTWMLPREKVAAARERSGADDPESPAEPAVLLAIEAYDEAVERYGPDDPRTMVAGCHLAHGLALEGARTEAAEMIVELESGLREDLGGRDGATVAAGVLRAWIEETD
ncbi:tetratricopeptide repeat protein [Actinoallomurus bryophytorum]|uniref:Tetratricopeptide repeat protein n=2 Tax=Actinoallomurus bryophytorum TaxID=1490222 RepID=A0A543CJE0_9ACTN|nr:tetratricopeptide repeat protein [Actinoallomurus bryophytorum]